MSDGMNILAQLHRHATDRPDRIAVREVGSGRTITWAALESDVLAFSARLRQRVPPRSTVMLRCANGTAFHIGFLGALHAGLTVFPVSNEITQAEMASAARQSGAFATIASDLELVSLDGTAETAGPAILLQSSGTTGLPRIVRREAPSLDAVASNCAVAIGITRDDPVLSCVPLCHSYGLEHGLLMAVFAGATAHLARGFDVNVVRRELAESDITIFPAVPSVFEMLANLSDPPIATTLRAAYSAGGPLPISVFERVRDQLNVRVGQLYGATELGSITFSDPNDSSFDPASVGRAMRGVELRVDDDHQLNARAPSMMSGYLDADSSVSGDGFFATGDLAMLDANANLHLTGRLKFLIDVGGLKVNPMEVEQALLAHPDVSACVVVPLRLSETIFRLKAIVTAVDPRHPPTVESIRSFAKANLSPHKVPRAIELRSTLPRSATGKILRHLLVETA